MRYAWAAATAGAMLVRVLIGSAIVGAVLIGATITAVVLATC